MSLPQFLMQVCQRLATKGFHISHKHDPKVNTKFRALTTLGVDKITTEISFQYCTWTVVNVLSNFENRHKRGGGFLQLKV
jgi:hypothetical protein